jgi:ABC-2 type transport system permease protein
LLASLLVIGLGSVMGYRAHGGVIGLLAAIGLVVLFGVSLSWVWTTIGALLRAPNAVLSVGLVVLFPLTFMSNVFVDPETMPNWLRTFTHWNPVTHLVSATRGLMDGNVRAGELVWVFVASAALVVVFAPLTLYLYAQER